MRENWLENFNPSQREAIQHGEGPLLIIAGAGTGKTMTLAGRVAHLLKSGILPERMLLLTFTRRAAAEMIRRAGNLADQREATKIWGGTFHAVANRLLRRFGRTIGLNPDFTVLDQSDSADLMNLVRGELGLAKSKKRFAKKETLVSIYSRMVSAREKLSSVLDNHFPWCADHLDDIQRIFERYTEYKRTQNVLDYDDLLLYWNELASAHAPVADQFDHILVDEYQDTNAVQCDVLMRMRARNKNMCVVGDDAQSIYSFRAATIRNILDFPEQYPGTTVVKLEQNYRSIQPILDASNAVMSHAQNRYTKELWSRRKSDQKPVLIHCVDENDQCAAVCDRILEHLEQGTLLMRQAVLFRTGYHSDMLEVELARRNIPFHKYGGLKFIESAHIKDMLALLRVLENPSDEISWLRIFLLMEGIGPATARRVLNSLRGVAIENEAEGTSSAPIFSPLVRLIETPPKVPPAAKQQFDALREMLRACMNMDTRSSHDDDHGDTSGSRVASQVERARNFYEPIFERVYDNAAMRLRDLEQLEHIAAGYRSRRQFLTDLTLDPPSSTSDLAQPPHLDEDYLILSTIHSAKGCEWDVVHIIHVADGMIPSDMAVSDEDGVDEERRLLYVAMTRAKDRLYAYFPLRYYHSRFGTADRHGYAQLTRYFSTDVLSHFEQQTHNAPADDDDPGLTQHHRTPDRFLRELWNG